MDHDLVAGLPARHALADLPHDARRVRAADVVAVLGVVAVAPHAHRLAERRPHVVVVHARGHHAHDDLEGARLGHLDLLDLEGVARLALALLADDPGGHLLGQLAGLDGYSDTSVRSIEAIGRDRLPARATIDLRVPNAKSPNRRHHAVLPQRRRLQLVLRAAARGEVGSGRLRRPARHRALPRHGGIGGGATAGGLDDRPRQRRGGGGARDDRLRPRGCPSPRRRRRSRRWPRCCSRWVWPTGCSTWRST